MPRMAHFLWNKFEPSDPRREQDSDHTPLFLQLSFQIVGSRDAVDITANMV